MMYCRHTVSPVAEPRPALSQVWSVKSEATAHKSSSLSGVVGEVRSNCTQEQLSLSGVVGEVRSSCSQHTCNTVTVAVAARIQNGREWNTAFLIPWGNEKHV